MKKSTSNETEHALIENELDKLSEKVRAISTKGLTKDIINGYKILNGARYLSSGVFQKYLIFSSNEKYFRFLTSTSQVWSWKSEGFSEKWIENITTPDSNFTPTLINYYPLPDINLLDTV